MRKSLRIVLVVVLLAALGALIAYFVRPSKQAPQLPPPSDAVQQLGPNSEEKPRAGRGAALPKSETAGPPGAAATASSPVAPTPNVPQPAKPEISPEARRLVGGLVQLNLTNGPLSPEKLAAWRQNLQGIVNSGPAAIPAIREFLQTKQDMTFESIGGSAAVGQLSLRLALMDALFKIGGPDATLLLGETLRTTTDPREIAILARNLEQQAPGEYAQPAIDSARAAMAEAVAGKLGKADVAPLFSVLKDYGGTAVVPDLLEAKGRWTYYSAIALGDLAEGVGIPGLVQMAQDTNTGARVGRSAALQVLAQMAADSTDARQALLEQARTTQIHPAIWLKMSALLGGEQLQLGGAPDTGLPSTQEPRISSYHLSSGNQSFYTSSVLEKLSPDHIKQRVELVDQLLATNPDATAVEALQRARTTLAARLKPGSP